MKGPFQWEMRTMGIAHIEVKDSVFTLYIVVSNLSKSLTKISTQKPFSILVIILLFLHTS